MVRTKLRPAKVRGAVRRRLLGYGAKWYPTRSWSGSLLSAGTTYGGWLVPDVDVTDWTCYCVGMGGDVSLERYLLDHGARVRSVDPVEKFVREGEETLGAYPRFTAHHAAIATFDGTIEMQRHHEEVSSSLSAVDLYDGTSEPLVSVPAVTLPTLMSQQADDRVDFLKLDVEGLEYELVPTFDFQGLGVRAFCVQLHHNEGLLAARRLVKTVERQGLTYVAQRSPAKLTFVKAG